MQVKKSFSILKIILPLPRIFFDNTMEDKKLTITNFVEYLKHNNLASGRLLNILKSFDGDFYDSIVGKHFENITDIEDYSLMRQRNVGKKTLTEFKKRRADYLQNIDSVTDYEVQRELFCCWLRSDISKTLKTIEWERDFIEMALLEKFERDGIELLELG